MRIGPLYGAQVLLHFRIRGVVGYDYIGRRYYSHLRELQRPAGHRRSTAALSDNRGVDRKSPHGMVGKLFAPENEPTLSFSNCQMPDFAHAAVFNSQHRPNEPLINLHWRIMTAPRTSVAS